ncbi:MAG: hypothetical protein ACP6IP_04170 [Candidatus Njordarchaeia archaeon]
MINFKIIVYTPRELLPYMERHLGRKFFVNDYYESMGVDFYRLRRETRVRKKEVMEVNYYFWILNPEINFDHIRSEYQAGADAAIVFLDSESPKFFEQLRKIIEEIYKVNRKNLPIVFVFKVKNELLDELTQEKVLEVLKVESNLLMELGALVGFYFFSDKNKKPIRNAFRALLGFLKQRILIA